MPAPTLRTDEIQQLFDREQKGPQPLFPFVHHRLAAQGACPTALAPLKIAPPPAPGPSAEGGLMMAPLGSVDSPGVGACRPYANSPVPILDEELLDELMDRFDEAETWVNA